jgi:hypothetical protein
MEDPTRNDLARILREWLRTDLSDSDQERVRALISDAETGRPTTEWVPGTKVINVIDVTVFGETLLVGFDWPLAPGRTFVYVEDLEDLSELDAEASAAILIARLDETINRGFETQCQLLKIGSLEVLVQDWE